MDAEPDVAWDRVTAFIRQHTHDVRNGLNCLDLECALLDESVADDEGRAGLLRMQKQIRSLAHQLRSLSAVFQDPRPISASVPTRELLLIWREKHAALPHAPSVRWVDELGDEKVEVDVEMFAIVFAELLSNAVAFAPGDMITVKAGIRDQTAIFELREPNKQSLNTRTWGEPFATTRRGGYGLGLWRVRRLVEANGATIVRQFLPEKALLTTQLILALV